MPLWLSMAKIQTPSHLPGKIEGSITMWFDFESDHLCFLLCLMPHYLIYLLLLIQTLYSFLLSLVTGIKWCGGMCLFGLWCNLLHLRTKCHISTYTPFHVIPQLTVVVKSIIWIFCSICNWSVTAPQTHNEHVSLTFFRWRQFTEDGL